MLILVLHVRKIKPLKIFLFLKDDDLVPTKTLKEALKHRPSVSQFVKVEHVRTPNLSGKISSDPQSHSLSRKDTQMPSVSQFVKVNMHRRSVSQFVKVNTHRLSVSQLVKVEYAQTLSLSVCQGKARKGSQSLSLSR